MARQKGIIKIAGTLGDVTFVESKTYGAHTRAARGTHKEAGINGVLQGNADKASKIGPLGSLILRQLKTIEKGFVPGDLWPRMTSRMFKAKSMKKEDLLQSLKGIELNERYQFWKLFSALPVLGISVKNSRLLIEIELLSHPHFSREVKASQYLSEVSVLFLDGKGGCMKDVMETEWLLFDEELGVYEMAFMVPKGAKYFLVVEGVKGGRDGKEAESFLGRGFRIGGWGKF